jgi:DNA primase
VNERVQEIAKQYLSRVKPSGSENIMAICPFHRKSDGSFERHGSFAMNTENGLWFCHSCKESGNLMSFLQRMGVSPIVVERTYRPLIEHLARNAPKPPVKTVAKLLTDNPLDESLLGIFDKCPTDLVNEGFSEDVLQEFKIGFDEAHMRITFPLRDLAGTLMGISGRAVIDDDFPRYKVYDTEYEAWGLQARLRPEKSLILWNAHTVYPKALFGGLNYLVVVEGFKACMWLHQAGIRDVVALLGSYMSDQQQWALERIGVPVYLMMDNDDAGLKGREYISKILSKSMNVSIVEFEGKQPTDITPEAARQALSSAQGYYLWAIKEINHGIR